MFRQENLGEKKVQCLFSVRFSQVAGHVAPQKSILFRFKEVFNQHYTILDMNNNNDNVTGNVRA